MSLHLWVPTGVVEAVKRLCVARGILLSAVVAGLLERWVGEVGEAGEDVNGYECPRSSIGAPSRL